MRQPNAQHSLTELHSIDIHWTLYCTFFMAMTSVARVAREWHPSSPYEHHMLAAPQQPLAAALLDHSAAFEDQLYYYEDDGVAYDASDPYEPQELSDPYSGSSHLAAAYGSEQYAEYAEYTEYADDSTQEPQYEADPQYLDEGSFEQYLPGDEQAQGQGYWDRGYGDEGYGDQGCEIYETEQDQAIAYYAEDGTVYYGEMEAADPEDPEGLYEEQVDDLYGAMQMQVQYMGEAEEQGHQEQWPADDDELRAAAEYDQPYEQQQFYQEEQPYDGQYEQYEGYDDMLYEQPEPGAEAEEVWYEQSADGLPYEEEEEVVWYEEQPMAAAADPYAQQQEHYAWDQGQSLWEQEEQAEPILPSVSKKSNKWTMNRRAKALGSWVSSAFKQWGDLDPKPRSSSSSATSSPARNSSSASASAPGPVPVREFECCVCLTATKCVVFLPCKHLCTCEACGGENAEEMLQQCPICTQAIASRMTLFI